MAAHVCVKHFQLKFDLNRIIEDPGLQFFKLFQYSLHLKRFI